jgi:SAM-dependent methyltransferase
LDNALCDLRFGGLLRGGKQSRYPQLGAYAINNSSYSVIRHLFRGRVTPLDVLVDVGCGKGRVINAWLAEGYSNRMIGVELDGDVAANTRDRLRRFPNVSIISGEIVANFPRDGTIFYLFNPFNASMMSKFKDALKECISARSFAQATVLYYNCVHADIFASDEACELQSGRLEFPYTVIHFRAPRRQGPIA